VSFHVFLSSSFAIVIVCVTEIATHLQVCRCYSTENPVILLVRCIKYPKRNNRDVHFIMSLRAAVITVAISLSKTLPAVIWSQFSRSLYRAVLNCSKFIANAGFQWDKAAVLMDTIK
jgi:hypothetical protein